MHPSSTPTLRPEPMRPDMMYTELTQRTQAHESRLLAQEGVQHYINNSVRLCFTAVQDLKKVQQGQLMCQSTMMCKLNAFEEGLKSLDSRIKELEKFKPAPAPTIMEIHNAAQVHDVAPDMAHQGEIVPYQYDSEVKYKELEFDMTKPAFVYPEDPPPKITGPLGKTETAESLSQRLHTLNVKEWSGPSLEGLASPDDVWPRNAHELDMADGIDSACLLRRPPRKKSPTRNVGPSGKLMPVEKSSPLAKRRLGKLVTTHVASHIYAASKDAVAEMV